MKNRLTVGMPLELRIGWRLGCLRDEELADVCGVSVVRSTVGLSLQRRFRCRHSWREYDDNEWIGAAGLLGWRGGHMEDGFSEFAGSLFSLRLVVFTLIFLDGDDLTGSRGVVF